MEVIVGVAVDDGLRHLVAEVDFPAEDSERTFIPELWIKSQLLDVKIDRDLEIFHLEQKGNTLKRMGLLHEFSPLYPNGFSSQYTGRNRDWRLGHILASRSGWGSHLCHLLPMVL